MKILKVLFKLVKFLFTGLSILAVSAVVSAVFTFTCFCLGVAYGVFPILTILAIVLICVAVGSCFFQGD